MQPVHTSMSTCTAESYSMQENPMLVALGEGDGKERVTMRERRREEGKEGRGMRGSKVHITENIILGGISFLQPVCYQL